MRDGAVQLERTESGTARIVTRDGWTTAVTNKGARLGVPLEACADGVRWQVGHRRYPSGAGARDSWRTIVSRHELAGAGAGA